MLDGGGTRTLELRSVERGPAEDGAATVALLTDAGTIGCRLHDASLGDAAVLWVFGAGGGLGGPAGGLYARLGRLLVGEGITSLELDYRHPSHLSSCVLDVLAGVGYLETLGRSQVVLVGHSFGGAVVIAAGAASERVIAVAALSSQTYGTDLAHRISPRPLLLMHGTADEILPAASSQNIYARAREPKRILLYPGCRHGLDQCRDQLDRDLVSWIREAVTTTPA